MSRSRFGRAWSVAAATVTTMALIAGCGGSDVQENATNAQSAVQPETSTDTTQTTTTGTGAEVPAAGAAAGTAGAATDTAAAPSAQDTTTQGGAPAKTATAAKQNAGATTGTQSGTGLAAEKMVASAAIFGGNTPCRPATLSEVNIGNVSTLSGVLGELFSPGPAALQVFVSSQNACGGLNGHKIKLYLDDDQGDPSTAA